MGVGGENRMGRIGSGAIERFIDSCSEDLTRIGITKDFCTDLMAGYAQRIPALMEHVFRESKSVVGIDELQDYLLLHVEENCEKNARLALVFIFWTRNKFCPRRTSPKVCSTLARLRTP